MSKMDGTDASQYCDAHRCSERDTELFQKPNGVFYIGNGAAGILATERFLAERPDADFATQSGPMLIIDGAIHRLLS